MINPLDLFSGIGLTKMVLEGIFSPPDQQQAQTPEDIKEPK